MTACACACGVSDIFADMPLPELIILNAIVLSTRPNPDGGGFEPDAVVSDGATPIRFMQVRRALRNVERVRLPLIEGAWSRLFVVLLKDDGTPFARGSVSMGHGSTSYCLEAAADVISICSRAN